jgi:hypothetical protein
MFAKFVNLAEWRGEMIRRSDFLSTFVIINFIFNGILMDLAVAQSEMAGEAAESFQIVAEEIHIVECDGPVKNPNELFDSVVPHRTDCQELGNKDAKENDKTAASPPPVQQYYLKPGIQWKPLLLQLGFFTGIQHGFRMTEGKTRKELRGPYFRDWKDSITGLRGWSDGGKFFTNYVGHPMQGAISAYVYKNNDTRYNALIFNAKDPRYWKMTGLAFVVSALQSAQFELGPASEASWGNIGRERFPNYSKMAYVDFVITPTLGTAWMVGEDVIDKKLIRWIEQHSQKKYVYIAARTFLNPMRTFSNFLRFKAPHYRDDRR